MITTGQAVRITVAGLSSGSVRYTATSPFEADPLSGQQLTDVSWVSIDPGMKFLTKNTDIIHLHVLKDLLEANGIPAVVQGDNTARMVSPFLVTEPSLWVYLEEQAAEAEKLILDPDYEVENGVDVDEFYRVTQDVSENPKQLYTTLLNWAAGFGVRCPISSQFGD